VLDSDEEHRQPSLIFRPLIANDMDSGRTERRLESGVRQIRPCRSRLDYIELNYYFTKPVYYGSSWKALI
jgi:hypothetical protein